MTVKISKPAINLREELASLRNQGGLPKEDKLYLDNLVDNGDFSNGTTGWSVLYGSISVSSGVLTLTEDGSDAVTARVYQSIPVQQGKTYVVKASVSNATAGTGVLTVAESIHALAGNPSRCARPAGCARARAAAAGSWRPSRGRPHRAWPGAARSPRRRRRRVP